MKLPLRPLSVVLIAALTSLAKAQTTPAHHSLSMDVKQTASGGSSSNQNNVKDQPGGQPGGPVAEQQHLSSTHEQKTGVSLSVEVRNLAPAADQAKLEYYFFGKPMEKGDQFIFDSGSKDVSVNPAGRQTFDLQSSELEAREERNAHINKGAVKGKAIQPKTSEKKTGAKVAGWMVRLTADGQVLQVRASSPTFETLGKNDAQLSAFPKEQPK